MLAQKPLTISKIWSRFDMKLLTKSSLADLIKKEIDETSNIGRIPGVISVPNHRIYCFRDACLQY